VSIESAEPSRPTAEEEARRAAASAADGVASPVAAWEIEPSGSPQEGQKRARSEASAEQEGQRINLENRISVHGRRPGSHLPAAID